MNIEVEKTWKVAAEFQLGILSSNLSGGTEGNHEISGDTWCPGRDSNQVSLDYKSASDLFFFKVRLGLQDLFTQIDIVSSPKNKIVIILNVSVKEYHQAIMSCVCLWKISVYSVHKLIETSRHLHDMQNNFTSLLSHLNTMFPMPASLLLPSLPTPDHFPPFSVLWSQSLLTPSSELPTGTAQHSAREGTPT